MNYMSLIESQLGQWYVKGYAGWTYMVTTSPKFPNDVAVECLDELYETIRQAQSLWGPKRRANAQEACCRGMEAPAELINRFQFFATLKSLLIRPCLLMLHRNCDTEMQNKGRGIKRACFVVVDQQCGNIDHMDVSAV